MSGVELKSRDEIALMRDAGRIVCEILDELEKAVAPGVTSDAPEKDLPPHVVERLIAATALQRLCRPRDVADAVLFLAGDDSKSISGATLTVDGGM